MKFLNDEILVRCCDFLVFGVIETQIVDIVIIDEALRFKKRLEKKVSESKTKFIA